MAKDTFVQDLIDDNDRLLDQNECLEERNQYLTEENERLKAEMESIRKDMEKLKAEYIAFEDVVKDETSVILKRISNINGNAFNWIVEKASGRVGNTAIESTAEFVPVPVQLPDKELDYSKLEDRVMGESVSIVKRLALINKTSVDSMVQFAFMEDLSDMI